MNTRIALLGQPNSGKSTVYNALTGARQHVGNWPGKTVEKNDGYYMHNGTRYTVTDLPGSYGLSGNSDEEIITAEFIRSGQADLVCILVDASQLERSMFMVAEFAALDKPAVLLLNMMDVVKTQKKEIDFKLLEKRLGIPVLPFTAADHKGYGELKGLFERELQDPHKLSSVPQTTVGVTGEAVLAQSQAKYDWIAQMLKDVTHADSPDYKLSRFDRLTTSPVLGKILCIVVVLAAFLVAMIVMMPFMTIGSMIPAVLNKPVSNLLNGWNVHPWLVSVFSMVIPNILYFTISMASFVFGVNLVFGFLEEIGFLARAAYQFDGVLSRLGLQGKAICPLLMGFGCTIGGACGTRIMDNWGQRMLAMAVVWAVPCGAIWGVIPVISSMFFGPAGTLLVCLLILVYMALMMWIVSLVFGRTLAPAETRSGMIMELPPYHKAHWKHIIREAFMKAWDIFKRALSTVTLVSLFFYAFSFSGSGSIEGSLLYRVGTAIEPVTRFFGLGWQTFMAFVSSAFAKEAVLGVLNAAFVGKSNLMEATFFAKTAVQDNAALAATMSQNISKPEALAFLFACTFNVPCVMALTTTFRESHSLKWTARVAAFYIGGALVLACIVFHISALFL
ncbi:MAG: ferrous iron transport protein B [Eubacteriales bacterium]|nr:ferrous iron transport protein B [Eubacteriales bacterium]